MSHLDNKDQGEGEGDPDEEYWEHNLSVDISNIEKYQRRHFKDRELL